MTAKNNTVKERWYEILKGQADLRNLSNHGVTVKSYRRSSPAMNLEIQGKAEAVGSKANSEICIEREAWTIFLKLSIELLLVHAHDRNA